jgi:hypothetical protein
MEKNVCYALDYKPVAEEKVVRANGRAAQKQPALRAGAKATAVNAAAVNTLTSGL